MNIRTFSKALTAVVAVVAASLVVPAAFADTAGGDVVRIDTGLLQGEAAEDHIKWSAIPYAAPPVDDLRWEAPEAAADWSGVRDATVPSPLCPQGDPKDPDGQEDCLYLDVTVPKGARADGELPVLVWLHGGGNTSGGVQEWDAARLAESGLMVVNVSYRLGALGFLSTTELDTETTVSGNYALMDQVAALQWVQRNAAAFGADAGNVTLAGESGGARLTCAQLASPQSHGLYHRAIMQSGACDNEAMDLASAREKGARAVEELGCSTVDDIEACLRERTPGQLLKPLGDLGFDLNGKVSDEAWGAVAGTPVLPQQPGEAIRNGSAAQVPLLIGSTRDEMRSFVGYWYDAVGNPLTEETYDELITGAFGDDAAAVYEEYPPGDYDGLAVALSTVLGDWGGRIGSCPVLRTAQAGSEYTSVYVYEFAEDSGEFPNGFPMGAYHGHDRHYYWDMLMMPDPELTPEQRELSAVMIEYWSSFARTGDPNGADRPEWTEFADGETVVSLSTDGVEPTPFAQTHHCDFWAAR